MTTASAYSSCLICTCRLQIPNEMLRERSSRHQVAVLSKRHRAYLTRSALLGPGFASDFWTKYSPECQMYIHEHPRKPQVRASSPNSQTSQDSSFKKQGCFV